MHIRLGFFSLLLLVLALFACQNNDSSTSATAPKTAMPPIDSLFSRYQEERLPLYPIEATIAGDPRYIDLLPSLSQAYRTALNDFYLKYHNLTQQYDRDKLSDNDRIGYDILIWECDINLEDLQYPKHLMPINQFDCLPL